MMQYPQRWALRPGSKRVLLLAAALLCLVLMVFSITQGSYGMTVGQVVRTIGSGLGLCEPTTDPMHQTIVWTVRLPRVLMAALCGMGLSLAGGVFQGVFRNPLVEPYILGVSSGAACGAALSILLAGTGLLAGLPTGGLLSAGGLAFLFSLLAMGLAYSIATVNSETPLVNLILAGTVISSVFTALLNLLKMLANDGALREITFWLMGGFYNASWSKALGMFPVVLGCLLVFRGLGWRLNVLSMGENEAKSMGLATGWLKFLALGLATLLTAVCVSQAGIISWVGLMMPHMARMLAGPDHRTLLPLSAFLGGGFLVLCDTLARTLTLGELPISILTSLLGAPYVIYLLRKNRQVYFE